MGEVAVGVRGTSLHPHPSTLNEWLEWAEEIDYSRCAYYLRQRYGVGPKGSICNMGCWEEPVCETGGWGLWPSEQLGWNVVSWMMGSFTRDQGGVW